MRIDKIPYFKGTQVGNIDDKPLKAEPFSKTELREKQLYEITCKDCETPVAKCTGNCKKIREGLKKLRSEK